MPKPVKLQQVARKAFHTYLAEAANTMDGDHYLQDALKGLVVELDNGIVIKVTSVMNAGFAGYQVGGYTEDGERAYRIGHFRY